MIKGTGMIKRMKTRMTIRLSRRFVRRRVPVYRKLGEFSNETLREIMYAVLSPADDVLQTLRQI